MKVERDMRYVIVKLVIAHPSGIDPDAVVNNCDYDFRSQTDHASILDTELLSCSEECPTEV